MLGFIVSLNRKTNKNKNIFTVNRIQKENDVILGFAKIITDIEDSVPSFCMECMHQLFQLITDVTVFS